jgi:hypothetical protein
MRLDSKGGDSGGEPEGWGDGNGLGGGGYRKSAWKGMVFAVSG